MSNWVRGQLVLHRGGSCSIVQHLKLVNVNCPILEEVLTLIQILQQYAVVQGDAA